MKVLPRVVPLGWVAALLGLAAASGLAGPAAHAATEPRTSTTASDSP